MGLVALMGLFVAAGVAGAHATSAGTLAAPLHAPAASKIAPASVHPAVPDATGVAISNGAFPTWITPGSLTLYWNLTVFGANVSLNSSTANQSVMMIAEIGNTQPYQDVPYASWAVPIVTGQANYQSNISTTTVLPFTSTWVFPPHTWLSDGRYFFAVFFTAANNSSGATFTSVSTTGDTQMLIGGHAAWASLDVPNPAGLPISTGNYSVVASYGGDWVIGSTLSITNPTGTVVFTANITQPGAGAGVANFTVVLTANWLIAEAGIYNATLTDVVGYNSTAHPSHSWSWTYAITVVASSVFKPVYLNQT
ncbi:MAG: hypothetical protein L3K08_00420, partial [Thermoplasmata archaeon]|nr:hypothetical protein [Thermoplasmata archaeon]